MKAFTQYKKHSVLAGLTPLAVAAAVFASGSVQAQAEYCGLYLSQDGSQEASQFSSCWYGAVGLGISQVDPEGIDGNGWYTPDDGDSSSGWNITIGRRFAQKWFAELKYADLGEAELTTTNQALDEAYPDAVITYKVPSLMAGYYLLKPRDGFNFFAKAGLAAIANKKENDGDTVLFEEVEDIQLAFGVGAQYDFRNSPWLLKLDVDAYDRDAIYAGLSIGRYFGGKKKPVYKKPTTVVMTPVPVVAPKPDPVAKRVLCKKLAAVSKSVQFEKNSSALTQYTQSFLSDMSQGLTCGPGIRIEVQAHTDSDGSENYNLDLSNRRAASVMTYLVDNGAGSCKLSSRGYGEAMPIATNATAQGRAKNRRVELKIEGDDVCEPEQ